MTPLQTRFIFLILMVFGCHIMAQKRYQDSIFEEVKETSNIKFSTQVPQPLASPATVVLAPNANVPEHQTALVDLYLDIYQPDGDQAQNRPLIILCFGGGFTMGSRGAGDIKTLAIEFAKRGYVTAAIDYRIGINLMHKEASERALYRGVQDSRTAVRFFRNSINDQNPYGIDANKIYIAGSSAGGMIALHNAYLDEEERTSGTFATTYQYSSNGISNFKAYNIPDLGCLDCVGGYPNSSGKANGVIAFAGALGALTFLNGTEDIPSLLFHSKDDTVIPYESGVPYGAGATQLGTVYGGNAITTKATTKNSPVTLYSYDNRGHNVHTSDGTQIYPDILDRSGTFLSELITMNDETLTISNFSEDRNTLIFKNPISRRLPIHLQVKNPKTVKRVTLLTMAGQIMHEEEILLNSADKDLFIQTENYVQNGLHLLKMEMTNGNVVTKKIFFID